MIIRVYHQQIYSNKLDNQDETDKFLEEHNPSKLKYKEIKNLKENFKIKKNTQHTRNRRKLLKHDKNHP